MEYCPHCKALYPEGKKFCRKCGYALVTQSTVVEEQATQSQRCSACGQETPVCKKFCKHCGAQLSGTPKTEPPIVIEKRCACPKCGKPVNPEKKFCGFCGARIQVLDETASMPAQSEFEPGPRVSKDALPGPPLPEPAVLPPKEPTVVAESAAAEGTAGRNPVMAESGRVVSEPIPSEKAPLRVDSESFAQQPRVLVITKAVDEIEHAAERVPKPLVRSIYIGASFLLVFAVAGILVWYFFWSSTARIIRLAETDQLVTPIGASAYDLYQGVKSGIFSKVTRRRLNSKVLPKLLLMGEGYLQKRYQAVDFRGSEMEQFVRIYDWAADLSPEDAALSSRKSYSAGFRALQRGSYQDAIWSFREAILKDPKWPLPLNDIGRAYVQVGDTGNAAQFYQQALQVDPNWVFPQLNLAGVYFLGKRLTEAEAGYRRAAELDSTLATPWYFIGEIYRAQGRDSDAIDAYGRAVALAMNRPSSAFTVNGLKRRIQQIQIGGHLQVQTSAGDGTTPAQLADMGLVFATNGEFSPDGRAIAFDNCPTNSPDSRGIYIMNVGTQTRRRVLPLAYATNCVYVRWSPDGRTLSFSDWNDFKLNILNLATGQVTTLPNDGIIGWHWWSPRGDRIVFERGRGGERELFITDLRGHERQLTYMRNFSSETWAPCWSPDGSRIAFTSRDNLYTIAPDGAGIKRLTIVNGAYSPRWSMDSEWILFKRGDRLMRVRKDGTDLSSIGEYPSNGPFSLGPKTF